MKKLVLMLTIIALGSAGVYAQGRFSVGAELALPQSDLGDAVGMGFGGSVRYEAPINENLSWMGTVGFLTFGEKDDSGVKATMIPVLAGAKYYFTESSNGFYAGAELGLTFATTKFSFGGESDSNNSSEFTFGPQLGYHLANIDISARYLIMKIEDGDANSIGFRTAYVFGGE